jgi:hypothetical protein
MLLQYVQLRSSLPGPSILGIRINKGEREDSSIFHKVVDAREAVKYEQTHTGCAAKERMAKWHLEQSY